MQSITTNAMYGATSIVEQREDLALKLESDFALGLKTPRLNKTPQPKDRSACLDDMFSRSAYQTPQWLPIHSSCFMKESECDPVARNLH